jgi:hypothetical protein
MNDLQQFYAVVAMLEPRLFATAATNHDAEHRRVHILHTALTLSAVAARTINDTSIKLCARQDQGVVQQ